MRVRVSGEVGGVAPVRLLSRGSRTSQSIFHECVPGILGRARICGRPAGEYLFQVHSHGHGCSMMRDRCLMPWLSVARNKQLGNRAPALVRLLVFPSVSAIRNNTKFKWCVEHGIRRKCMPDLCDATLDSPTNLNRFRISNYAAICSAANFACRRGIPSISFIFVGRKDTVSRRQFSGDRLDQGGIRHATHKN